jgi:hypothetical protein
MRHWGEARVILKGDSKRRSYEGEFVLTALKAMGLMDEILNQYEHPCCLARLTAYFVSHPFGRLRGLTSYEVTWTAWANEQTPSTTISST